MLQKTPGERTFALGTETFTSKVAIRDRVQAILRGPLGPVSPTDQAFLLALFAHHPWFDEKLGPGIRRVHIVKVLPYGHQGFDLERIDGSMVDISYRRCLEAKSQRATFRSACRKVAVEMVKEAKDRFFAAGGTTCPINGDAIDRDTCHADHEPPWTFEAIVTAFIQTDAIDVETVTFVSDLRFEGARIVEDIFADKELIRRFDAFHRERARLRIMSARANTSMLHATTAPNPTQGR